MKRLRRKLSILLAAVMLLAMLPAAANAAEAAPGNQKDPIIHVDVSHVDVPDDYDPIDTPDVTGPTVNIPIIDVTDIDNPDVDEPGSDEPSIDEPSIDEPGIDEPNFDESIPDRFEITLPSGVKYVPYGVVLPFSTGQILSDVELISDRLPAGLLMVQGDTLDITGIPLVSGTFTFTIRANFYADLAEQEFDCTLTIAENTDSNVWNATSDGYSLTTALGTRTTGNSFVWSGSDSAALVSSGSYSGFSNLYMDGKQLARDTDYTVQEGSTIFQLRKDFLKNAGNGPHTIAALFLDYSSSEDYLHPYRVAAQNFTIDGTAETNEVVEPAELDIPDGVKYIPYYHKIGTESSQQKRARTTTITLGGQNSEGGKDGQNTITMKPIAEEQSFFELVAGTLPSGLTLNSSGELSGTPMVYGEFSFTVLQWSLDKTDGVERTYQLEILNNTAENIAKVNDYKVITPIGTPSPDNPNHYILDSYQDETLVIDAPYRDFMRMLIDGKELKRGEDYEAKEGSTLITIRAQTFKKFGEGTHTLAEEFREGGKPTGKMKIATQNYTMKPKSGGNAKPSGTAGQQSGSKPNTSGWPFSDVSPDRWFYPDVKWAHEGKIMTGTTATSFAPNTDISQATIVTVLARLADADLSQFEGVSDSSITAGKWYTSAAVWAKQSGLLPDYSVFTGENTISRDQMAIMLVKYMRSRGKDTKPPAQPVAFADAEQMSQDGDAAFQILYKYNIFRGVGKDRMDPEGATTRAQFAALAHRLSSAAK